MSIKICRGGLAVIEEDRSVIGNEVNLTFPAEMILNNRSVDIRFYNEFQNLIGTKSVPVYTHPCDRTIIYLASENSGEYNQASVVVQYLVLESNLILSLNPSMSEFIKGYLNG